MHTFQCTLAGLICGRRIEIPKIQRGYMWATGDTSTTDPSKVASSKLIEDLEAFAKLVKSGVKYDYYLGGLVIDIDSNLDSDQAMEFGVQWDVLDGQQRITTLALLFHRLFNRLQTISHPQAADFARSIEVNWLTLNDAYTKPERGWTIPIYPRRNTDRDTLKAIIGGEDLNELMRQVRAEIVAEISPSYSMNMIQNSLEFEEFLSKMGSEQILHFTGVTLNRVRVAMIFTNSTGMGIQMFQTANSRGLPLNILDLIRSTVMKHNHTTLHLSNEEEAEFIGYLDAIEKAIVSKAGTGDPESLVKRVVFSWLGCRTGARNASGTLALISSSIEDCRDKEQLFDLIMDLNYAVTLFVTTVDLAAGGRDSHDPLQPVFCRLKDQWQTLALGAMMARIMPHERSRLDGNVIDAVTALLGWYAAVVEHVHPQAWVSWYHEAHLLWSHSKYGSGVGINEQKYIELRNSRLAGLNLTTERTEDASFVRAIMSVFESRYERGHGEMYGGAPARQALIKLFNAQDVGSNHTEMLGNYFLLKDRFSENGPTIKAAETAMESANSLASRLTYVRQHGSSMCSNGELRLPSKDARPQELQGFIRKRTQIIQEYVNAGLAEFMDFNPYEE